MAVSDIEAVLEFLRKNGLSDSESAFMEDILEKSQLGSVDFQRFLFPMASPSPALQINLPNQVEKGLAAVNSSSDSSDDDFVSLVSSFTDLCSLACADLNPCGTRAVTRASSQASSDRLSQFGTALDYHEFDMENDLTWYKENEEDYDDFMPPCLENSDSYGGPSEDKFVMSFQIQNRRENELDIKHDLQGFESVGKPNQSDNLWPFDPMDNVKDGVHVKDYYNLDESIHPEGGVKDDKKSYFDHSLYAGEIAVNTLTDIKDNRINCFHFEATVDKPNECVLALEHETDKIRVYEDFESTSVSHNQVLEKGSYSDKNSNHEANDEKEICRGSYEHEIAGSSTSDEFIHNNHEEDYEVFNLRIIHRKNRTGFEENKDLPIVMNSIIAGRYYVTEYLGSAAFSRVVQAHDLLMGVDVCLKIIKNDKDFFDQSLDEIKLLKFVNKHDPGDERHILRLYDYFYHQEHLFIVCELLRANLYEFQKFNRESGAEPYFTMNRLQIITRQCLEALDYLHNLGIIHCDLKPENILIKSYRKCEIKVIDLGSSCFLTDNLSLYVQSRSYRAPEVILGHSYDQKIDLWSLGCILAELYSGEVLFPNEAVVMLLARMIALLGPIDMEMLATGQVTDKYFTKEYDLYHINEDTNELEYIILEESSLEHHLQISDVEFLDFLQNLLEINPLRRPTAREALEHPWLSYSYNFSLS